MFALQKCDNCNMKFSWIKIYKKLWGTNAPIECSNCNTEHKLTAAGRFAFGILVFISVMFGNLLSPFENVFVTLGAMIAIVIIGSFILPYFVKYKMVL